MTSAHARYVRVALLLVGASSLAAQSSADGPPEAPILVAPSGVGASATPTFSWNAANGAAEYYLWVNNTAGTPVIQQWYQATDVCSGASCSVTSAVALSPGYHVWWVQARNSSGSSPWSSALTFTVGSPPPAPTLVSPTGAGIPTSPPYIWDALADATDYYLWVNNGAGTPVVQQWFPAASACAGATCSATPAVTLAAGFHTWWIQGRNLSGDGPWSAGLGFTVGTPPTAPALVSPTGSGISAMPTYAWNAVVGATDYYLWVNNSAGVPILQQWYSAAGICDAGSCGMTPSVSLAAGYHTWWVQAKNASGEGPWSTALSFIVGDVPAAPVLVSPTGAGVAQNPAYTWNAVLGASEYYLWVNGAAGTPVVQMHYPASVCVAETCSVVPPTTLSRGYHVWWVQAKNDSGDGSWSASMSFVVGSLPGTATLLSPSGPTTGTRPTYRWSPVDDATEYYLWVNNSASVPVIQEWFDSASCTTECEASPTTSLLTGSHTWWIQARNGSGDGPWSAAMSFTIMPTGMVAAGQAHSLVVTGDGAPWGFGSNSSGELGTGDLSDRATPSQMQGMSDVQAISGGEAHTIVLRNDGTVWAVGDATHGQLGNGGTTGSATTVPVVGITAATAVTAGGNHSLALLATGMIVAWGDNTFGQLGDGSNDTSSLPVPVSGLSQVVAIAAGWNHSLALRSDGSVWSWGANFVGQLGDGSTQDRNAPVQVSSLQGIGAIISGAAANHSLAIKLDQTVWVWGQNDSGQLGTGTTDAALSPVSLAGLPQLRGLAAGGAHTLAVTADGHVLSWGANDQGQLGDGTNTPSLSPVQLAGLSEVLQVAAGSAHSLALTGDGRVLAWGDNAYGQTGDGSGAAAWNPVELSQPFFVWRTSAPRLGVPGGLYHQEQDVNIEVATPGAVIHYTLNGAEPTEGDPVFASGASILISEALTLKAKAWAAAFAASLTTTGVYEFRAGPPQFSVTSGTYPSPLFVSLSSETSGAEIRYTTDGSEPSEASSLYTQPLLITTDVTVRAKAFRSGWTESETAAVTYTVVPLTGEIAAGGAFSLALDSQGRVWAWGQNSSGQLGDGTATSRPIPDRVMALGSAVAIAAGTSHSLAVAADRSVWTWGHNASGQLGDGTTDSHSLPVVVPALTGVVAVAGGNAHSLALRSDGTVWAWGENARGQLGDGTYDARHSPVQVAGLADVVAVAAGAHHSLALRSDGTISAWGGNDLGQLGNWTQDDSNLPVEVGLGGATAVSAGGLHSLAVTNDGSVWAWGDNSSGQLGHGATDNSQFSTSPVQVVLADECGGECDSTAFTDGHAVVAGGAHSLALKTDATAWSWGANASGQLGDGAFVDRDAAGPVGGLTGVIRLAAGEAHNLALDSELAVWAWGRGLEGQIGDGTTESYAYPVRISEAGFQWKVGTPVFSPSAGTYTSEQTLTMTSATPGATIHYTTDGSEPTDVSPLIPSGGSVEIDHSLVLRARAFKDEHAPSNERLGLFTLVVRPPILTPPPGSYDQPTTITITEATAGAVMHYLLQGGDVTEADPIIPTGGTILMEQDVFLQVKAFKPGWEPAQSGGFYWLQALTPTFDPPPGTYGSELDVAVTVATVGAVVRYTTDGTLPNESSEMLAPGERVHVSSNVTLAATAFRPDLPQSQAGVAQYFLKVTAPLFSPAGGVIESASVVNMASPTPGAAIRYSLDGSDPTVFSQLFQGALLLQGPSTVRARAFRSGWLASDIAAEDFTVGAGDVSVPTFSLPPGSYATAQTVTITCATVDAIIRYTMNGQEPTEADLDVANGGTLIIDRNTVLKARAWRAGVQSATRTGSYSIGGAIAAGFEFTLSLKSEGTVWAWGTNDRGQLGNGSTDPHSLTPVQVDLPENIVAIAAGGLHALALDSTGLVWSWGDNGDGQLGDGTNTMRRTPVLVQGLSNIRAISAGLTHNLALRADGRVLAWGSNGAGQLGIGTRSAMSLAVLLNYLPSIGIAAIDAAVGFSFAVTNTGTVYGWGSNSQRQLGLSAAYYDSVYPVPLPLPAGLASLTGANVYSVGLVTDGAAVGTVWRWGTGNAPAPTETADASMVSAAGHDTLVLKGDGTVRQLPFGNPGPSLTPLPGLKSIVSIAAGITHFVALKADGTIWTWGSNARGELGDGSQVSRAKPLPVPDLTLTTNGSALQDTDGDLLSDSDELRFGADPLNRDTNGDGILDGVAVALGLSPTNLDMDADGIQNGVEISQGSDPFRSDTDADGLPDGQDCRPLDPTVTACPDADPGDHTPPNVILIEPANATLVSSNP